MKINIRHASSVLLLVIGCASISHSVNADSMRCRGNLIDVGDTKNEVVKKCGDPEATDAYCEKMQQRVPLADGTYTILESCENVEVWSYDRGRGKFAADLVFAQGKVREIRYGDRNE